MRITFHAGTAARYDPAYMTERRPWFGRCWGFWFPRLNWNGGGWGDTCTDLSLSWLCFWCGLLVWWRTSRTKPEGT